MNPSDNQKNSEPTPPKEHLIDTYDKYLDLIQTELKKDDKEAIQYDEINILKFESKTFADNIDDSVLENLAFAFKRLSKANTLRLVFGRCKQVTDKGIQSLSEGFKNLESGLNSLYLDVVNCTKLTDEALNHISAHIEGNNGITEVSLLLNGVPNFSEKGHLNTIGVLLKKDLKVLALNVNSSNTFGNECIFEFGSGLKKMTNLEKLTLNLADCKSITDKSLNEICNNLCGLDALNALILQFGGLEEVTNTTVENLSTAIQKMNKIQNLGLFFQGCSKITGSCIVDLAVALESKASLTHLSLNFRNCDGIQDEAFDKIKSAASTLPNLEHKLIMK